MDGDNIFLGMKDEERQTRDKTTMRMTAPRAEAVTRLGPETAQLTAQVLTAAATRGQIDIAMELTQAVTTRLFGAYFGTPGRSVQEISAQARLLFGYVFADLGNDPEERCLQFQDLGLPGMSDWDIRNNLIGLIVGAMPQAPMLGLGQFRRQIAATAV
jgi:cytochrome P450